MYKEFVNKMHLMAQYEYNQGTTLPSFLMPLRTIVSQINRLFFGRQFRENVLSYIVS
jgi:hypothetical protein